MKDLDTIYFAARELSAEARAAYLAEACEGAPEVRARVEQMLAVADEAEAFITDPLDDAPAGGPAGSDANGPDHPAGVETPDPIVGQSIGRYKILERIGEGGCGVVYVAEQTEPLRRRVALKLIKAGMDTKQVIARFEAERQALAMMDHSNIAKVFDAGSTELGRPYFVMELVRGPRITRYCDAAELGVKDRLQLFVKVCHAIQHAHQKGIIHRDIKPSNILVTLHDGEPVPKVIDFGIAKAIEGRLVDATVYTRLQQFIGTPAYMSPEQAGITPAAAGDVDTRSDIYSLGVLLYELLCGAPPFDAEELMASGIEAMRRTICERAPPRPSTKLSHALAAAETARRTSGGAKHSVAAQRRFQEHLRELKGDLDWIVMRCLEKDRTRRYETANALAVDLRRHMQNEPVEAGPPSRIYAAKKFVLRHKWPMTLAMATAVLTVAGLVGTSIGLRRATLARVHADEQAARALRASEEATVAEAAARTAETKAVRQAYSASMLGVSDARQNARIDTARFYLNNAPEQMRGWEWWHHSSRLDLTVAANHYARTHLTVFHVLPDARSYYDVVWQANGGIEHRDMRDGSLLRALPTTNAYVRSWLVADGKRLVAQIADARDAPRTGLGDTEVWDLENGTRLAAYQVGESFHVTPDGEWLASWEKDQLLLVEVGTGQKRFSSIAASGGPMCFRPDGERLAFVPAGAVRSVALTDTSSFEVMATFEGHVNQVSCMAFSADGRWLATGSLDKTIRVTDVSVEPPVVLATLRGHTDGVSVLCFSPDGAWLASGSWDGSLRLWDPLSGQCVQVLLPDGTVEMAPSFLPDGRTLAAANETGVRLWDVGSLDAWVLRGHQSYVYPVLLSPDGVTIYSGGWDGYHGEPGSLRIWDAATGDPIVATGIPGSYVRAAALSRDGGLLAVMVVGNQNVPARVDLLDTATGKRVASITELLTKHHDVGIDSLVFDATGENLVWLDHTSGTVRVANTLSGTVWKTRNVVAGGSWGELSRVALSADGNVLAVTTWEGNVSLLDAHSLEPMRQWQHGHSDDVTSLSFSPDNRRLLTTSEDGIIRVWETATGERVHDLVGHASRVWCAAYSPDGKRIASGGNDHNVRIWDAETFDQVSRLSGHDDYVYSLAWRADSQELISGSGDRTIRIWDTEPLTTRVQARRERKAILEQVEPMVRRLFTETEDPGEVVRRIKDDAFLGPRARQVALQVALRMSMERENR